jgi:restriction system protein
LQLTKNIGNNAKMEIVVLFAIGLVIWFWIKYRTVDTSLAKEQQKSSSNLQSNRERTHADKALDFVNQNSEKLKQGQAERIAWQLQFAQTTLSQLDQMDGLLFEQYLAGLLRERGYNAQVTRGSGDFGADIILSRGNQRIAVQAKRWRDTVGVGAVQEVIAAREYYQCHATWVIATSRYTSQAQALASKANVTLIDRTTLALWVAERATSTKPHHAA